MRRHQLEVEKSKKLPEKDSAEKFYDWRLRMKSETTLAGEFEIVSIAADDAETTDLAGKQTVQTPRTHTAETQEPAATMLKPPSESPSDGNAEEQDGETEESKEKSEEDQLIEDMQREADAEIAAAVAAAKKAAAEGEGQS